VRDEYVYWIYKNVVTTNKQAAAFSLFYTFTHFINESAYAYLGA